LVASQKPGRAVRLNAPGALEVATRLPVAAGESEAIVEIGASGICGTDVAIFSGETPVAAGRVLGHEGAGIVRSTPRDPIVEVGARVVVDPTIACGGCALCREGQPNLCVRGGLLGRELDGVFADEVSVPAANLHVLPDSVALADAPLVQVLATVVHAHDRLNVVPGRVATVVGLGCTGQLHAQLLRHRGARVLGVGRSVAKRELASRLACEWVVEPQDAAAAVRELDPRGGADVVVESAGTLDALSTALKLVRPGGTVLAYGSQTAAEGALPFYLLYKKEVRLLGSRANLPRDFESAITLAATGGVSLAPLVTDRLPLAEAETAFARSASGALKVVMTH
jgi:2-desacetyl-2-hydroxyethyl bacteriochlorophyllide A dehydrogenase